MFIDNACDIYDPEPLSLSQIDASPLAAPAEAWDAACVNGYSWCSMSAPVAYEVPACIEGGAGIVQVLEQLSLIDQSHQSLYWDNIVYDRTSIASTIAFASSGRPRPRAVLQAVEPSSAATTATSRRRALRAALVPQLHRDARPDGGLLSDAVRVVCHRRTHGYEAEAAALLESGIDRARSSGAVDAVQR